jgi:hypothetical protein
MSTPNQKAEERPILFVLHNIAGGEDPYRVDLVIRPEELTKTEVSRMAVTQTLGGAFVDSFGKGIPSVQISGHTGWGSGNRKNGNDEFQRLYFTIFEAWHRMRKDAVAANKDPDLVKLMFADMLDEFLWMVAPQNFVLRRSRSRPLLFQYQINLTWVSDNISETMSALKAMNAKKQAASVLKTNSIASLVNSLAKIEKSIADKVTNVLGVVKSAVDAVTALTAQVLSTVTDIVRGVLQVPAAIAQGMLGIAKSLTQAASNIYQSVAAIDSIPLIAKAYFQQVASAFDNAFCVLSNSLHPALNLPNYSDLYGASNCSSTTGGSPISPYDVANPFNVYQPPQQGHIIPTQDGVTTDNGKPVPASVTASLQALTTMDPVLNPLPMSEQVRHMNIITAGLGLAA